MGHMKPQEEGKRSGDKTKIFMSEQQRFICLPEWGHCPMYSIYTVSTVLADFAVGY